MPRSTGSPILCDFGEARFGKMSYTNDIQPYIYRAPEIILDIAWSHPADIWNVGVMVCLALLQLILSFMKFVTC